jgi:hypothetical protein
LIRTFGPLLLEVILLAQEHFEALDPTYLAQELPRALEILREQGAREYGTEAAGEEIVARTANLGSQLRSVEARTQVSSSRVAIRSSCS